MKDYSKFEGPSEEEQERASRDWLGGHFEEFRRSQGWSAQSAVQTWKGTPRKAKHKRLVAGLWVD